MITGTTLAQLNKEDLLRVLGQVGIMADETVQGICEKMADQKYLDSHPYRIYQNAKGFWETSVKDDTAKKGRKSFTAKTKEELEKKVVAFYRQYHETVTVSDVFEDWIKLISDNVQKSTITRYRQVQIRHFGEFGKKDIRSIAEYDVEKFLRAQIQEHDLTEKSFCSLKTNVKGIFNTARKEKYISFRISDVLEDINIPHSAFRPSKKSLATDEERIFPEEEEAKLLEVLKDTGNFKDLGIMLLLKTGMRIGELCALKKSDISSDCSHIHIHATETRYKLDDKGPYIHEVRDGAKTDAGRRDIIVTAQTRLLLQTILSRSDQGSEWLFADKTHERFNAEMFRQRLYKVCNRAGIKHKGPHTCRRTFISKAVNTNLPKKMLTDYVGHNNISTTYNSYTYDRTTDAQKLELLAANDM